MDGIGERKWKPHFNFITLHYIYIIGLVIVGSIVIYPMKNMPYIDALFFASGACTQSGLNTIDVNTIKMYQQFVIYVLPLLTNPITINAGVVYVRLHWFEKRFKHIVKMSRQPSRARSMSMPMSRRNSLSGAERGIRERDIRVLHKPRDSTIPEDKLGVVEEPYGVMMQPINSQQDNPQSGLRDKDGAGSESSSSHGATTAVERQTAEGVSDPSETAVDNSASAPPETTGSNIQFADHLATPRDAGDGADWQAGPNTHIAFAENDNLPQREKALRIPGPREFENGDRAREVDDDDTYTLNQTRTLDDGTSDNAPRARSYSFAKAASNASSTLRVRKLPTVDRILPHATSIVSSAFSMGTAGRRKSLSLFPARATQSSEMPYLSYQPTVGRNSQFLDLTEEQREELGGIEYRSLKLLGRILIGYFCFFHISGVLCLLPWIYRTPSNRAYIESLALNPAWWAIFSSQTAFMNAGFTLTPDSMNSLQRSPWALIVMIFLIVIGNTGFPCLLRFIIWCFHKIVPRDSSLKECLNFLLDHPRRCFTLLFPSRETWILFWVLVCLNGADVILFIVLDISDPHVSRIPVGDRILDAIFQAVSTRTSGTAVINLASLHVAVQVSYMVMMYISTFPVAISVRRTNVYEEKSLGVYGSEHEEDVHDESAHSYVGFHLRKQLSFDLWYVFLGLFIIAIAEGSNLGNPKDSAFSIFAVLFEIISAYGTVGLSLGYPTINTSFSGKLNTVSKLVVVAMQIRGRHRGLPYELDRAILLPNERHDAELVSVRRYNSNISSVRNPSIASRLAASQRIPSQAIED